MHYKKYTFLLTYLLMVD